MMRIANYGRFSSDLQNDKSIDDQFRLCDEKSIAENWEVYKYYSDAGISGASLYREGIQALLKDAMNGKFDIVLCEALDRLSRDQEDIAHIYKRMVFAGVKIFTLSEGEINELHIGLKGTYNAIVLKDLAQKTRRGLRGKVENGKSGGGIAYGYKVIKHFDANGEAIKGDREIDQNQARIVLRIFHEYAIENKSPKAIASNLNRDGVPCPSGKAWGQSTINGNRRRGTGILNNELYIGRLVWNRQHYIKNPDTGKRVTRLNDPKDWVIKDIPELRIVDQGLWDAVKVRQKSLDQSRKSGLHGANRPQYLLSGLLKCGACGGGYAKINTHYYGCAAAKNKGDAVCTNKKAIKREKIEGLVLEALKTKLMRSDMLEVFCVEYTKRMNELIKDQDSTNARYRTEQAKALKERENLVQALKDGVGASLIKDDLERVTARIDELEVLIEAVSQNAEKPLIHPKMAQRYKQAINQLCQSLNASENRAVASEHIRGLVEKIVLTPQTGGDELSIDLYGDLAGILKVTSGKEKGSNGHLMHSVSIGIDDSQAVDSVGCGGWI